MTLGEGNPVSLCDTRPNIVTEAFVALNVGQGHTASLGELVMPAWFEDEAFWMALYPYLLDSGEFCEWPKLNTRGYLCTLGVPTQSVLRKGYPLAEAHCTAFAQTAGLFV